MILITAIYSQNISGKLVDIDTETYVTIEQAAQSLLDTLFDTAECIGASTDGFPGVDDVAAKLNTFGTFSWEIVPDEDDFEDTMSLISAKLI